MHLQIEAMENADAFYSVSLVRTRKVSTNHCENAKVTPVRETENARKCYEFYCNIKIVIKGTA